jgi:hypothetical protein
MEGVLKPLSAGSEKSGATSGLARASWAFLG